MILPTRFGQFMNAVSMLRRPRIEVDQDQVVISFSSREHPEKSQTMRGKSHSRQCFQIGSELSGYFLRSAIRLV